MNFISKNNLCGLTVFIYESVIIFTRHFHITHFTLHFLTTLLITCISVSCHNREGEAEEKFLPVDLMYMGSDSPLLIHLTIKSYQIFPSDGHLAPFLLPRLLFQICSPGGTDLQFLNFIQWEVLFGKRNEKCFKSCFALRVVGEYIK